MARCCEKDKKKDNEIRGSVSGWVLHDWLCYYNL